VSIVGDKTRLAFEIGAYWKSSKQHQHINVWLAGRHLTAEDDLVYLPSFYTHLEEEIVVVESASWRRTDFAGMSQEEIFRHLENDECHNHRVLRYDATVCRFDSFYFEEGTNGVFLCSTWPPDQEAGHVFGVQISRSEFLSVLKELLSKLSGSWV